MLYRQIIFPGALILVTTLAATASCMAIGALAIGEPAEVATDGLSMFTFVNAGSTKEAKAKALNGCKTTETASLTSKKLCKIVVTFSNKCIAEAIDPKEFTPGWGWAMADNSDDAKSQAMEKCRATAGPDRRDACEIGQKALWCDGRAK